MKLSLAQNLEARFITQDLTPLEFKNLFTRLDNVMLVDANTSINDIKQFLPLYKFYSFNKSHNYKQTSGITFDIDSELTMPMVEELIKRLTTLKVHSIVYHTVSSTSDRPRIRVLLPFSQPYRINNAVFADIVSGVAEMLGIDSFDPCSLSANHAFILPVKLVDASGTPVSYYEVTYLEGSSINMFYDFSKLKQGLVHDALTEIEQNSLYLNRTNTKSQESTRNAIDTFNREIPVDTALRLYAAEDYVKVSDNLYQYVHSTSQAGGKVYGQYFITFHSSDEHNGKRQTSFDILMNYRFGGKFAMAIQFVKSELLKLAGNADALLLQPSDETIVRTVQRFLDNTKTFSIVYDYFTNSKLISTQVPWPTATSSETIIHYSQQHSVAYRDFRDSDYIELREYIKQICPALKVTSAHVNDALLTTFNSRAINSVQLYLASLDFIDLDDEDVVRDFVIRFIVPPANRLDYTVSVFKAFLVGAVARVLEFGTKFDVMPVIYGKQGTGKSLLLERLGMSWFSDSFSLSSLKESIESLQGTWIMEIGELAAFRKQDLESVKQFLTKTSDKYRPAYGREVVKFERHTVFCGTTNEKFMLRDPTGNRRFFPIEMRQKDKSFIYFNLTQDVVNRLWKWAYDEYTENGVQVITELMLANVDDIRMEYLDEDGREILISQYLETKVSPKFEQQSPIERKLFYEQMINYSRMKRGLIPTDETIQKLYDQAVDLVEVTVYDIAFCALGIDKVLDLSRSDFRFIKSALVRLGWKQNRIASTIYGASLTFVKEQQ